MREADDVSNSNSREDKLPKDILTEEDVRDLLDETINQEKASIASLWKSKRG